MKAPWFTYRARPDHDSGYPFGVVDGDTLDVVLDQGLSTYQHTRVRLKGIDTTEIFGPASAEERERGNEHREFVLKWLQGATDPPEYTEWPLLIATEKDGTGKYGRYVANVVRRNDAVSLADSLTEAFPEVTDE